MTFFCIYFLSIPANGTDCLTRTKNVHDREMNALAVAKAVVPLPVFLFLCINGYRLLSEKDEELKLQYCIQEEQELEEEREGKRRRKRRRRKKKKESKVRRKKRMF
ncbi:uncharacterized protein LOC144352774 isoform X1 [Saccoglossus kowalevskii]